MEEEASPPPFIHSSSTTHILEDEKTEEKEELSFKGVFIEAKNDIVKILKETDYKRLIVSYLKNPRTYIALAILIIVETCFGVYQVAPEWHMIFLYGWIFIAFTPLNNNPGKMTLFLF
jgi:hypothetical protein